MEGMGLVWSLLSFGSDNGNVLQTGRKLSLQYLLDLSLSTHSFCFVNIYILFHTEVTTICHFSLSQSNFTESTFSSIYIIFVQNSLLAQ